MHTSVLQARGPVSFPEFAGERVYMEPFLKAEGLPRELARWQPTVDAMLDGIETSKPIYLMIDQLFVPAGKEHRRPGLHIDGYWIDGRHNDHRPMLMHGPGGGGIHSPGGTPMHGPGSIPIHGPAPQGWAPFPPAHGPQQQVEEKVPGKKPWVSDYCWTTASYADPEAIVLASNVAASRAFVGQFDGYIGEGGDCSRISTAAMAEVLLKANRVYAGNVACLHESLPVPEDCYRTLVRLNVPGWTPKLDS